MTTVLEQGLCRSTVVIFIALLALSVPEAEAQVPRPFPTSVPTPTPSPTPAPEEDAQEPPATPVPERADDQPSATPVEAPAPEPTETPVPDEPEDPPATPPPEPAIQEPAAAPTPDSTGEPASDEEVSDVPEKEQEVNPGDVAFTDYQPFDLEEIEYEPVKSKWKNFVAGMRGMSRYSLFDDKLKFRIGGKVQVDGTAGQGSESYEQNYVPVASSVELRRGLLFAAGRFGEFNFSAAFEFGADWGVDEVWIEGSKGGLEVWGAYLGKLRVGWMSEPFSLERQTSAYNGGFLERSLPVQTIAPGSNIGAMVHDSGPEGRFTWAAGLFSVGQSNDNNASNSLLSLTGRATYRPVYRDEGRRIVHVGLSLSSRSPGGGSTRYRSRPEARFVNYLVDTEPIEASQITLVGLEVATVNGPMWFAAEYVRSDVSAQLVGDPVFQGSYAQVGWFLTGESRPYRGNSGTFDRLRPMNKYLKGNPFKKKSGGAWEVVGRISRVDLNGGDVRGGDLIDFSAALNWYVNATTRVALNYVHARPEDRGYANIFLMRVQFQPW